MITLRIRTHSGHVQDVQFAELLAIDGKPYQPAEEVAVFERLAHLEGRVSAIETIFTRIEEEAPEAGAAENPPTDGE